MAKVLDNVNSRTQLVGRNRLELLLFKLGKRQRFDINVFKVREVIKCPTLTRAPQAHPVIRGIANMRGQTITVMDLALAVGKPAIEDMENSFVIVAEYNRHVQGFLVGGVDKIVNMNWEEIKPPPKGMGGISFLTAVTEVDDELVEIIEIPTHPWFVACQFHPEFTSTPRDGHPLFSGFIRAASLYKESNTGLSKNAVM